MTDSAVVPMAEDRSAESPAAIMERVIITGDLAKLSEAERVVYYFRVCESLGLNPLTKPFDYINLNGKLQLYPNKDCAAQLRKIQRVSITDLRAELIGDIYTVTVAGSTNGRSDLATGAVNIKGLGGEGLANAYMKAETKAKRRLSLSLAGLGFADESEIEDIPPDEAPPERKSLAERAAAKAEAIASAEATAVDEVKGEFTPEVLAEVLDVPSPGCLWRVARRGGEMMPCTFAPDHDGDHSFKDVAIREGGKVIPPGTAA